MRRNNEGVVDFIFLSFFFPNGLARGLKKSNMEAFAFRLLFFLIRGRLDK
jgi:hypothetical protein